MLVSSSYYKVYVNAWQYPSTKCKKFLRLLLVGAGEVVCYLPAIFFKTDNAMLKGFMCGVIPAILMMVWYIFIDKFAYRLGLSGRVTNNEDRTRSRIELHSESV